MGRSVTADTTQYRSVDRLLHRIAFQWPAVQSLLTSLEDDLYSKALEKPRHAHPVFITGLPRAGTTLLLELLHATGEFATYTYRNMPFVLSPLLWQRLTGHWQRRGKLQERAHGDGMQISYDSPEAFEEILWQTRLPGLVDRAGPQPTVGAEDLTDDFIHAFRQLASKIVLLGQQDKAGTPAGPARRYLSKNNANLARLDALRTVFPNATTLVCCRHPADHVASLHTQHQRFLAVHADDRFAQDYMRWTGHFDLGANFRPADFAAASNEMPVDQLDERFWLGYWIQAYEHALAHDRAGVRYLALESLLTNPQRTLSDLSEALCLAEPAGLLDQVDSLRAPHSSALDLAGIDPVLAQRAEALYLALQDHAIGQAPSAAVAAATTEFSREQVTGSSGAQDLVAIG